jgi:uncharacterized membrane protein
MQSLTTAMSSQGANALGLGIAPPASLSLGRSFFGVATMASGVQQLVTGDFVRLVPKAPAWMPSHPIGAYLVGIVLVAAGLAILSDRMARSAASVVGAMILLMFLLLAVPNVVANPLTGFMWTNPLKSLALVGGAAILVGSPSDDGPALSPPIRGFWRLESLGAVFLAIFLVVCGMQHFVYRDFVDTLVPSWIPAPRFWTYFTGTALIAGGVGILLRPTARLAATLSAVMIFLWVLLLHIPRALAGPNHANETAGVFEALAISGVALMVARTRATSSGSDEVRGPRS